jgi:hypothetical protein
VHEDIEITKIEVKEAKKVTHHPHNEHKMYPGKTQYKKKLSKR